MLGMTTPVAPTISKLCFANHKARNMRQKQIRTNLTNPASSPKNNTLRTLQKINLILLEPTPPEHELVPSPTLLLDSRATSNFIDQKLVTSHHLPATTLPNKVRIVMADGRITLAS
jgi:hypothetical protein